MRRSLIYGMLLLGATGPATPAGDVKPANVVKGVGTIEPEELAEAAAVVQGAVVELGSDPQDPKRPLEPGAAVKAGTVLARIDPAPYEHERDQARAELERAEANLALARARAKVASIQFVRAQRAAKESGDVTVADLAEAEFTAAKAAIAIEKAGVARCQAALARAEMYFAACTIRAPIDGVIVERRVNLGTGVSGSAGPVTLFTIARDLKKLQVHASIAEADVHRIAKGQPARFSVEAFPKLLFQGRVLAVRPAGAADGENGVYYTVVVEAENSQGRLLPGMSASVTIEVGPRPKP